MKRIFGMISAALLSAILLTVGLGSPALASSPAHSPSAVLSGAASEHSALAADPSIAVMDATGNHTLGSSRQAQFTPLPRTLAAAATPGGVQGLDVSAWQKNINWNQVWTNGARFVYVKATENTNYASAQFSQQYSGSAAVGIIRGAYHFAVPNASSGAAQANYFVSNGGAWHPDGKTLPPLLDIEYNPYGTDTCYGLPPAQMVAWIADFSATVLARTGRSPAIYSTTNWWTKCTGNSSNFSKNPLFIARYPANIASGAGTLPASWSNYSMWQYASSGIFPGDQDVFNGSYISLQNFAGTVDPFAALDVVTGSPGQVHVKGWAFDPSTSNPISVHVYINGMGSAFVADGSRPDLPPVFGDIGVNHGYDLTIPASVTGELNVCVYAINVGAGVNVLAGSCRTIAPTSGSPSGNVDAVTSGPGQITVSGWALDPDTTNSIPVHVYVDSTATAVVSGDSRPDVAMIYPGYGAAHGYTTTVAVSPGPHRVCSYGINAGPGSNSLIACSSVIVPGGSPIGTLDSIAIGPRSASITGWSIDPDIASPVSLIVTVDATSTEILANVPRADVGAAFPRYGSFHGFNTSFDLSPGPHAICVRATNVGTGNDAIIGCRSITQLSEAPIGNFDIASGAQGTISIAGWTIDPQTVDPNSIQVTIDATSSTFSADTLRADVASAYPGYGLNHGFSQTLTTTAGVHLVCVSAVSTSSAEATKLGCRTVTVA